MIAAEPVAWRVVPGFQVRARCWGDECVVYHFGSGDTHLIDIHAYAVLQALERAAASADVLVRELAASCGLEENRDLTGYVERALRALHGFSLIEPDAP